MVKLERAVRRGKKYFSPIPTTVGGLSVMLKILPLYLKNKAEKTPKQPLGPFRTNPRVYETPPASGLRVTWMGHSVMLVEIDGVKVLIDPVWDERAAPVQWAGPKRFFPAPIKLEDLPRIDLVLLSHDHYDHLGANTVRQLARMSSFASTRWVTPLSVGRLLTHFGVPSSRITELDWTESTTIGDLQVTALPARHFSGRSLWNRNETLWASFVLAGPEHRIYYGADSGEWEGFAEIGRAYGPFDLTMLEIGAFHPLWSDIHMGPDGAIRAFQSLGRSQSEDTNQAGLMMPIHWGLFDLALHAWREPIERVFSVEGLKLWSPEPGLPTEVVPGKELRSLWWH